MKPKKLTIISSFAEDLISYKESSKKFKRSGGPAFWIAKTLKTLKTEAKFFTGKQKSKTKIFIDKKAESGQIKSVAKIQLSKKVQSDFTIISTITNEFNLAEIEKISGQIILDLQGYVRAAQNKNKIFCLPNYITRRIMIMKGTEKELRFLDKKLIRQQKRKMLIITRGEKSVKIIAAGKTYLLSTPVIKAKDTLGAGDTFLTAFTIKFMEKTTILQAGKFAIEFTANFLKNKI